MPGLLLCGGCGGSPRWYETVSQSVQQVDALVVGGGPAGLAAALALRAGGAQSVVVVEREVEAGGVPRHCEHIGFGVRDLRRFLTGPQYARRWVDKAADAGVDIWTRTMVTGWAGERHAELTGPLGRREIVARTVVLATGARERPRSARLIPGTRPAGVFTTGQLQQWVYHEKMPVGQRALIVGAEHVSYSAVLTLRHARVRPVALVTDLKQSQTVRPFDFFVHAGLRVPLMTHTSLGAILGRERVEGVVLYEANGTAREMAVDTIVFTGDWIPDYELARLANLEMNVGTNGPGVDADGRTSLDGIFAVGNLVHPVETADVASTRASLVGAAAAAWLRSSDDQSLFGDSVRFISTEPLKWISPNLVRAGQFSRQPVLLRSTQFLDHPRIHIQQGARTLATYGLRKMIPNRSHHVPSDWYRSVDFDGGPVTVTVSTDG